MLFIYIQISMDTDKLNWICRVGKQYWIIKKNVTTIKLESNKNDVQSKQKDNCLVLIRTDISILMKKFEALSNTNIYIEKCVSFYPERCMDTKKNGRFTL